MISIKPTMIITIIRTGTALLRTFLTLSNPPIKVSVTEITNIIPPKIDGTPNSCLAMEPAAADILTIAKNKIPAMKYPTNLIVLVVPTLLDLLLNKNSGVIILPISLVLKCLPINVVITETMKNANAKIIIPTRPDFPNAPKNCQISLPDANPAPIIVPMYVKANVNIPNFFGIISDSFIKIYSYVL